jgi:hypothetical protein
MDGTTALLSQLNRILDDVGGPPADLSRSLDALVRSLAAAIPSFSGLLVNLGQHGHTVTLAAFDPPNERAAASSLRRAAPHHGTDGETSLTLLEHLVNPSDT